MTSIIIIATALLCIAGLALFIWSLIDTRKKFYSEYLVRKGK